MPDTTTSQHTPPHYITHIKSYHTTQPKRTHFSHQIPWQSPVARSQDTQPLLHLELHCWPHHPSWHTADNTQTHPLCLNVSVLLSSCFLLLREERGKGGIEMQTKQKAPLPPKKPQTNKQTNHEQKSMKIIQFTVLGSPIATGLSKRCCQYQIVPMSASISWCRCLSVSHRGIVCQYQITPMSVSDCACVCHCNVHRYQMTPMSTSIRSCLLFVRIRLWHPLSVTR